MYDLKLQVRSSFRTEMFAAGLYYTLAKQYGKNDRKLSQKLKEASEQEQMHGRMFRQFYSSRFGEDAGSEKVWLAFGRFAARMIRPVPLEKN